MDRLEATCQIQANQCLLQDFARLRKVFISVILFLLRVYIRKEFNEAYSFQAKQYGPLFAAAASDVTGQNPMSISSQAFDIHPVNDWIVLGIQDTNLIVYDYKRQNVLHNFLLSSIDDKLKEERINWMSIQRDPHYAGYRKNLPEIDLKRGVIRLVKFYDKKTRILFKRFASPNYKVCDSLREHEDRLGNYIIIVTDIRVFFFDYVSYKVKELKASQLLNTDSDSKIYITSVEFLHQNVYFGYSGKYLLNLMLNIRIDGTIASWDMRKWQLDKRWSTGNKSIIGMIVVNNEFLVSCNNETINVWNITDNEYKNVAKLKPMSEHGPILDVEKLSSTFNTNKICTYHERYSFLLKC